MEKRKKDVLLEISGNRYNKITNKSSITFPTRLVSKGGVYSCNKGSIEENDNLLRKAGFIKHENCVPNLAKSQATKTSKADAELRKMETLDVKIISSGKERKKEETSLKTSLQEEAKEMEEKKRKKSFRVGKKAKGIKEDRGM